MQAILPVAFAAVLMIRSTGGWQTASKSAFPVRAHGAFAKLVRRFDHSINNSCCLLALRNLASMERIVDEPHHAGGG